MDRTWSHDLRSADFSPTATLSSKETVLYLIRVKLIAIVQSASVVVQATF
jgi:hypothetical protein